MIASLPSLSLLTLAGMTPGCFEVEYHWVPDIRKLDRLPDCDLAAISTFTAQVKDAYALADHYREAGVKTVIGGHHVTALPGEALRHCDAVVVGEAELTWPRVLGRLSAVVAWAASTTRRRAGIRSCRLAVAPVRPTEPRRVQPDHGTNPAGLPVAAQLLRQLHHDDQALQAEARGKRDPRNSGDQGNLVAKPFTEFAYDNSFVNRSHSKKLLRALADEGVKWFTETDVALADDPEILDLMRESGCAEVLIGFESPTASSLDGVELNNNRKRKRL